MSNENIRASRVSFTPLDADGQPVGDPVVVDGEFEVSVADCPHVHDPGPFPVVDLGGRTVVWDGWVEALRSLCRWSLDACRCGFAGAPWMTCAMVSPLPGETALMDVVKESKRQPGSSYVVSREVRVGARRRLWAFKCRACGVVEVYDRGWSLDEWDVIDSELFEV